MKFIKLAHVDPFGEKIVSSVSNKEIISFAVIHNILSSGVLAIIDSKELSLLIRGKLEGYKVECMDPMTTREEILMGFIAIYVEKDKEPVLFMVEPKNET